MTNKNTKALSKKATSVEDEKKVILQVANSYGLTSEQTKLLFAIRRAENGSQGREFGVLVPEAMRFANDPDPLKSLATQAMWAAGTIKKRYNGDLEDFASRWAPVGAKNDPTNLNANWVKNVKSFMEEEE